MGGIIRNPGVPTTRQVIAGTNMTGGGPLSDDITLNATGGGGVITKIQTINANSILTTFSFTGIVNTYDSIFLRYYLDGPGAITVRLNNDATAIYSLQKQQFINGRVDAQTINQTGLIIGNSFGRNTGIINLLNYKDAANKIVGIEQYAGFSNGSGSSVVGQFTGAYSSVTAISRIDIICDTAPTLGRAILYGFS